MSSPEWVANILKQARHLIAGCVTMKGLSGFLTNNELPEMDTKLMTRKQIFISQLLPDLAYTYFSLYIQLHNPISRIRDRTARGGAPMELHRSSTQLLLASPRCTSTKVQGSAIENHLPCSEEIVAVSRVIVCRDANRVYGEGSVLIDKIQFSFLIIIK